MSHQAQNLVLSNSGRQTVQADLIYSHNLSWKQSTVKLSTLLFIDKCQEFSIQLSTLSPENCSLYNQSTCSFQAQSHSCPLQAQARRQLTA